MPGSFTDADSTDDAPASEPPPWPVAPSATLRRAPGDRPIITRSPHVRAPEPERILDSLPCVAGTIKDWVDAYQAIFFWLLALPFLFVQRVWTSVAEPIRKLKKIERDEALKEVLAALGGLSMMVMLPLTFALPALAVFSWWGIKWVVKRLVDRWLARSTWE